MNIKTAETDNILLHGGTEEAVTELIDALIADPFNEKLLALKRNIENRVNGKSRSMLFLYDEFNAFRPKTFTVETALACNLKCPECAIGADMINSRSKGYLKLDNYKIISDKIKPYAEYLYLHLWGEPMLNKNIFDMIAEASRYCKTNISTNATILDREKAEKLIASGVTEIIVSIDGFSQEVYEQYRVGGKVEDAFNGLKYLVEYNRKYGNRTAIYPQFIVFKHNQHEIKQFEEYVKSLGLKAEFKAPYIRQNDGRFEVSDLQQYRRREYSPGAELKEAMRACVNPKEVFTINLDGSVVVCCHDYDKVTNFGNIYEKDVLEIWNSPEYRRFRWDIFVGEAPKFCQDYCMTYIPKSEEKKVKETSGKTENIPGRNDINDGIFKPGQNTDKLSQGKTEHKSNSEIVKRNCLRKKYTPVSYGAEKLLAEARALYNNGEFDKAFDVYEVLSDNFPQFSTEVLAEVYDRYQTLPEKDRYSLYQSRIYDFNILPDEKVLDIGSGHKPFPYATHLSDISTTDHAYGRAGVPFKHVGNKPVYEFDVEDIPFENKDFDFIYISHVMEHVDSPEQACRELMRVGKRGYIETPAPAKDMWLNTAKTSNHRWKVRKHNGVLIFEEYSEEELEGLRNDILMNMHVNPQSKREKALSALIYLKPEFFNTMMYWEGNFEYRVVRKNEKYFSPSSPAEPAPEIKITNETPAPETDNKETLRFMQVHTFYQRYLDKFYGRDPRIASESYNEQVTQLLEDGFSGIHIFAPYMAHLGYDAYFTIANNRYAQEAWLKENAPGKRLDRNFIYDVTRQQIEMVKPDVLYLSDPITFDARFLQTLSFTPKLVIGWRAADIPPETDWRGFDIIFSGLKGVRETALEIGAKEALHFIPGFPDWINQSLYKVQPDTDLVFGGSYTLAQHTRRNAYLKSIAENAGDYSARYFLSGDLGSVDPAVARITAGEAYGMDLYREMKRGKIIFDGRGDIRFLRTGSTAVSDIARRETMNMRIFETTGLGRLLLTEYFDNLTEYFEPDKEIVVFENERELIEKIRYYTKHDSLREEIALNGHKKCLENYSMAARAREFDKVVRGRK